MERRASAQKAGCGGERSRFLKRMVRVASREAAMDPVVRSAEPRGLANWGKAPVPEAIGHGRLPIPRRPIALGSHRNALLRRSSGNNYGRPASSCFRIRTSLPGSRHARPESSESQAMHTSSLGPEATPRRRNPLLFERVHAFNY